MNDKYKRLVEKLANKLHKESLEHILKHVIDVYGEADTTDLLNLILSAHLSALSSSMRFLSKEHDEMYIMVNKFLANLIASVGKMEPISNIEVSGIPPNEIS